MDLIFSDILCKSKNAIKLVPLNREKYNAAKNFFWPYPRLFFSRFLSPLRALLPK
jgi:hypothetical protein